MGSEGRPTRIVLVDDHTMFREGLAGLLASYEEIEVVGSSSNGAEAVVLAEREKPDMVIMEIEAPLERGRENLSRILAISSPRPKVVVLTMFENPYYVRDLLKAGASAYLTKSTEVEDLVGAVRSVAQDTGRARDVVVGVSQETLELSSGGYQSVLSGREIEVLLLTARGLGNRQIATTLGVSEATVRRHLANIYPKMGVGSRMEAVKEALANGWISLPEITEEMG